MISEAELRRWVGEWSIDPMLVEPDKEIKINGQDMRCSK
jgi:hypothetical protein